MARVQFVETVMIPGGPGGTLIPVAGVAATPYNINLDGSEGSQATAYVDRTSMTQPDSLATDSSGSVVFWLDAGDYNIHMDDQQSPPRITSYVRGFTAPIIDTNQLVVAAQNLIQFTGDLKHSIQAADHGLKADGTYEWLLITNDVDGGGRKIDHTLYPGIYALLGSPTPDGAGMIRLPNISGRVLVAAGHATGLTNRNLLDFLGEEVHQLTVAEMANHNHLLTDPTHRHTVTVSQNPSPAAHLAIGTGDLITTSGSGVGQILTTITASENFVSTGITIGSIGADGSHNNMQPSAGMNLFVKS